MSLKKLLLVLPVLMTGFAIDANAATYNCWQTYLPGQADRGANEYLFLNAKSKDYNATSTSCSHCKGKALVCGHKAGAVLGIGGGIGGDGCYTGAKVIVDGTYTWKDTESMGRTVFECDRNGGNEWYQAGSSMLMDFGNCADSSNYKKGDKYERMFENGDREYYCIYSRMKSAGSGKACIAQWNDAFCYMTKNQSSCYAKKLGYDRQKDTCTCKNGNEIYRDGKCIVDPDITEQKCYDRHGTPVDQGRKCRCADDKVWNDQGQCVPSSQCVGVCVGEINMSDFLKATGGSATATTGNVTQQQQQQQQQKNNSDNTNGNNAGGKSGGGSGSGGSGCLNRTTANGRACCRADNTTVYDKATDTCTCVIPGTKTADTTKEWKHDDGAEYGACITKGSTEVVNPCDAICTNYVSIVVDSCAMQKVNNYANVITQITQQCSDRTKCNPGTVGQLVNQIEVAVASCANQPVEPEKPQLNEQRLAAAVEAIDKYRSGLDVSVWKDAEGNFNTARLVSDSIAGVVLGTAGGLITSSVVKKNQVKNGFEDVVCTIGGQAVGSYGDEISVGIK